MHGKKSKKTLFLTVLIIVNILYTYSIIVTSDAMGDIVSPVITLIASGIIFWGFVKKQESAIYKWFGWLLTLAVFSWFLCDFWWGVQTLFLHGDPEQNLITIYGYSLTNIFLFLAIVLTAYQDLKKINKVQALLDIVIVSICISVLLWLFVFEQNNDQFLLLLSDPVSMACIMSDIIIYAWINVWSFSTRQIKPLVHHRILVT
ncbi:MAG: hypothetical protein PHY47_25475, partial [Lachnospiraceae bacterium]|nr:hypothetical protein [Lachnospiraceae bacterium]